MGRNVTAPEATTRQDANVSRHRRSASMMMLHPGRGKKRHARQIQYQNRWSTAKDHADAICQRRRRSHVHNAMDREQHGFSVAALLHGPNLVCPVRWRSRHDTLTAAARNRDQNPTDDRSAIDATAVGLPFCMAGTSFRAAVIASMFPPGVSFNREGRTGPMRAEPVRHTAKRSSRAVAVQGEADVRNCGSTGTSPTTRRQTLGARRICRRFSGTSCPDRPNSGETVRLATRSSKTSASPGARCLLFSRQAAERVLNQRRRTAVRVRTRRARRSRTPSSCRPSCPADVPFRSVMVRSCGSPSRMAAPLIQSSCWV